MTKNYEVAPSFNLQGFLDGCRTGGLKLSAETESEQVHGNIQMSGNALTVNIAESASGREEPSALSIEDAVSLCDAQVTANNS